MMNVASICLRVSLVSFALLLFGFTSCQQTVPTSLSKHPFIPYPVAIQDTGNSFLLTSRTSILVKDSVLQPLARIWSEASGIPYPSQYPSEETSIVLMLDADTDSLGEEGYRMSVEEEKIIIAAAQPHGVFNGIQTLIQLIPVGFEEEAALPTGTIVDYPRYSYRGAMLDVSRHFFEVADVKRYIDFLAAYKMNVLHLHLSDDQGWRIEIKSRPQLTAYGSTSEVGDGPGGFYTQEEYRDMVAYAAQSFITVVPEIDMPGHTQAALASYPDLNCDGEPRDLYRGVEVGFSTLCTENEATYAFIDDILRELAALTPGPYLHIGGDESLATDKEDYIYFVNRVQKIVDQYDKIMIGWDEIAEADLSASSLVQQWNNGEHALKAAEKGHDIILSPAVRAYLDMKYDSTSRIGYTWASLIEVDHAYNWDPDTINPQVPRKHIRGIEAPLWTETVENMKDIEYLAFPRLPGYAEIGWTPQVLRNWNTYRIRLARHAPLFESRSIDFYRSPLVDWQETAE